MKSLAILLGTLTLTACGRSPTPPPSPAVPQETVVAEFDLYLSATDPPVKVARVRLIKGADSARTEFDASAFFAEANADKTGVFRPLVEDEGLGNYFSNSPGWIVSPYSTETLYLDLHPNTADQNVTVQILADGTATWGIASDDGDTDMGQAVVISIDRNALRD